MFEDMDKKISGWINAGTEKAKGMSESLRLTGVIKEEENKQTEFYKMLGKYFYECHREIADGEAIQWCNEIDMSKQRVEQYQEKLQPSKGAARCPNCGAAISVNAAFCQVCGAKTTEPKKRPGTRICSTCGAQLEADAGFCTVCGSKVTEVSNGESQNVIEENKTKTCPTCGTEATQDQKFCMNCGTKMEEQLTGENEGNKTTDTGRFTDVESTDALDRKCIDRFTVPVWNRLSNENSVWNRLSGLWSDAGGNLCADVKVEAGMAI